MAFAQFVEGGVALYDLGSAVYKCITGYKADLQKCKNDCQPCASLGGCVPDECADSCMKKKYKTGGMNTNPATVCLGLNQEPEDDPCVGVSSSLCEGEKDTSVTQSTGSQPAAIPQPPPRIKPPIPQPRPDPDKTVDKDPPRSDPTTTAGWTQESSRDIQQCSTLQSAANTCCNNPSSCSGSLTDSQKASYAALVSQAQLAQRRGDSAGLQEICQRSKSMNINSGNVNTGFANVCYSKHSMCTQTCSSALTKWQQRLNNCGSGCDRSLVSNTVNSLLQRQDQCRSYAQLENRIRAQAYSAANDTALSSICQTGTLASTENPSQKGQGLLDSMGDGLNAGVPALMGALPSSNQQDPGSIGDPTEEYCGLNPNAPSCYTAPQFKEGDGNSSRQASAGGTSVGEESFNVDAGNTDSGNTYPPQGAVEPTPAQNSGVPNGGAGGIPAGDSNSSQSLASNTSEEGQNLPAMLGSGVNPNILHGEGGGGGYSNPVGSAGSGFEFKNRYGGSKFPQKKRAKNYKGLDLKKFLPGGARDPAGLSAFHPDIGPKHVSFFKRVSSRIRELCHLKKLLDCQ